MEPSGQIKLLKSKSFSSLIGLEKSFSKKSKSMFKNKNNKNSSLYQASAIQDKHMLKTLNNSKCLLIQMSKKPFNLHLIGLMLKTRTKFMGQPTELFCLNFRKCHLKKMKIRKTALNEKSQLAHVNYSIRKIKNRLTFR